jgi:hypothetical protein
LAQPSKQNLWNRLLSLSKSLQFRIRSLQ